MASGRSGKPKASAKKSKAKGKPPSPLELIAAEPPEWQVRDLAQTHERLVGLLGPGEWRIATQSADREQPLVAYGRRLPLHVAHGFTIYRLDEDATHATEVGHYFGYGHTPCDVALLPDGRLAILTPNKLMLAITKPALQVVDELPLEASTCTPVLGGNALLLNGYRELSRRRMETITIALGIYDSTLLELGRIEKSERFGFRSVGDRVYADSRELVGFAELYAGKRDEARARRAELAPRTTAPIRLLPFAGVTEARSTEPALPAPPRDAEVAATLPPSAWVDARCHGYTCIELPAGKGVELAVVEAATKRVIHFSPAVHAKHNYFVKTRFPHTLLCAADTDAFEVELATGRATPHSTGDTDVQHLGYAGDLVAIIRFTASGTPMTYQLEWYRDRELLETFPIAAERLTTLCDGKVVVAHCLNFAIPSWFFAAAGDQYRLLGFTRAIKQLWERDGRCFYETAAGDVYELTGLAAAAERCLATSAAPIDLWDPCVADARATVERP